MKSIGDIDVPVLGKVSPTSPTSLVKAVIAVVMLLMIAGIGIWLYKKIKEKVPIPGGSPADVWA